MKAYRLFGDDEAAEIVAAIREQEWEVGRASSKVSTGKVKRNLELKDSNPVAKEMLDRIETKLREHSLWTEHFVAKILPPKFNWYRESGEYRMHSDAGLMGDGIRTDLACTVFLTDGYEGGELVIGGMQIKGKAGMCVVYECWKPHYVTPVTDGDRICAITWMQSRISDESQRDLLNLLHGVAMEVGNQEHFAKLGSVHERLFKLWMRN